MRGAALLLICLASTGYAKTLQNGMDSQASADAKALASLVMGLEPVAGWQAVGPRGSMRPARAGHQRGMQIAQRSLEVQRNAPVFAQAADELEEDDGVFGGIAAVAVFLAQVAIPVIISLAISPFETYNFFDNFYPPAVEYQKAYMADAVRLKALQSDQQRRIAEDLAKRESKRAAAAAEEAKKAAEAVAEKPAAAS